MLHSAGGFRCSKCGCFDRSDQALRQALYDYRALYGEKITNRQFREFMGVENIWTATKMLNRAVPQKEGKNKGTVHFIPLEIRKSAMN